MTKHFVARVAGNVDEGVVDVENRPVRSGNHDAFAGVREHGGSEPQLLLGLPALGDVANDSDGVPAVMQPNRSQRDFNGDFLPVFPARMQFSRLADRRSLPAALKCGKRRVVRRKVAIRHHQSVQILSQDVFGAVAENVMRCTVPIGDVSRRIRYHNRFVGCLHDRLERNFGLLAIGDVEIDASHAQRRSLGIPQNERGRLDVSHFACRPDDTEIGVKRLVPAQRLIGFGNASQAVIRVQNFQPSREVSWEFGFIDAVEREHSRVPDKPILRNAPIPYAEFRRIRSNRETLIGFLQTFLGQTHLTHHASQTRQELHCFLNLCFGKYRDFADGSQVGMLVEAIHFRLADEGVRVRRLEEELSGEEIGYVRSTDGDRHGDVDQTVLALIHVVSVSMRQLAGKNRIALPATFSRQWMNAVKLRTQRAPAGRDKNIAIDVQNGSDRTGQRGETLAQTA